MTSNIILNNNVFVNTTQNDSSAYVVNSISYNTLVEEKNENGVTVTYACEYQTGNAPLSTTTDPVVSVVQFYDLAYSCSTEKQNAANYIAEQLLMKAALAWNILPIGDACTDPQNHYGAWLFGVSSQGPDEFVSDFGCQRLTPNATKRECCQVVHLEMKFIPTGGFNITKLQQFVKDQLDTADPNYSLLFRTASVDDPLIINNTPNYTVPGGKINVPTISGAVQSAQSPEDSQKITVSGAFLISLLVGAVLGVFLVMYRRYRSRSSGGSTVGKDCDDFCNSTMEHGPSIEDCSDFHVTVINDNCIDDINSSFPRQYTSLGLGDIDIEEKQRDFLDDMDMEDLEEAPPAKYAFDLGDSFRNDVMGTYAPTTMQVVAPYPLEDTSCDSEADSWAQTDGTVGSLEERLEQITAEI